MALDKLGNDRRNFLKTGALAGTATAFGAYAIAANQTVAQAAGNSTNANAKVTNPLHTSMSEEEIAKLPRVKQEMVAPPFAPKHEHVASGGPKVVEVTMTIKEMKWQVDMRATSLSLHWSTRKKT